MNAISRFSLALWLAGALIGTETQVAVGQCAPVITVQPQTQYICIFPGGVGEFPLSATGTNLTYQWQQQDLGDTFPDYVDIHDGPVYDIFGHAWFMATGTNSAHLTLSDAQGYAQLFRCVISNGCGHVDSNEVGLLYCLADINCSGSVTVQDIFDFLNAYFTDDSRADVNFSDDISIQDIFDYLVLYFDGCE